jgi:hypothetical protein
MLRVAAFVMFGVHLRIEIPNQQMRNYDLNGLRRDSGPMPGHFARRLFLSMLRSRPRSTLSFEMRPISFASTGLSFQLASLTGCSPWFVSPIDGMPTLRQVSMFTDTVSAPVELAYPPLCEPLPSRFDRALRLA